MFPHWLYATVDESDWCFIDKNLCIPHIHPDLLLLESDWGVNEAASKPSSTIEN